MDYKNVQRYRSQLIRVILWVMPIIEISVCIHSNYIHSFLEMISGIKNVRLSLDYLEIVNMRIILF